MLPILLSIGVLYLLAIGAGRLSAAIGIPRVTGYLIAGIAAGPSFSGILGLPALFTHKQLHALAPVHDIILGLIVFTIGGSFSLRTIRKIGSKLFRISTFDVGFTALFVGFGTALVGASPIEAAFLSAMSITTAPAATQMVIRECQSEGQLTDTVLPLIVINNLVAITAFIVIKNSDLSADVSFVRALVEVFEPLVLGAIMGVVIAIMDQRLTRQVERQILVLASVAVTTGAAMLLDVFPMLAVLFAGMVAVNATPNRKRILADLSEIDYPLYVLFFIMAGAELHLESLVHMGGIGLAYVVMRAMGKYFGCRLGAGAARSSLTIRNWLGPAMLAQAGLAIGLANILAREWPGPGGALQTVVLASVVVFEMVGPLLTRLALINAGEVPVLNLLAQRSPVRYREGLHQVIIHFKNAFGIASTSNAKNPSDILIGHIMRTNVEVLSNMAPFNEVLKALGHSRYDRLPVVNEQNELVGVIKYTDVANTLYDPSLRNLVVADEITTEKFLKLTPEDTLESAMAALKDHPNDAYLFVVDNDNPKKLVGVVRQNDVLSTQMRLI
ncbi:MAG: cation:proton antiporter [Desulfobacteraceae bacterium]|jgi:Kef-type K+ transport system membrane component KefB